MPKSSEKRTNLKTLNSMLVKAEKEPKVKQRVRALQKFQFEKQSIDANLAEVMMKMRFKLMSDYKRLDQIRADIISGKYEPNEEESRVRSEDEDSDEKSSKKTITNSKPMERSESIASVNGIPGFWLKAMLRIKQMAEWIEDYDQPILLHLIDIEVAVEENPWKIVLSFRFNANEYFSTEVLTKIYEIKFGANTQNPLDLTGYYPIRRYGSSIDWKEGKNVTQMVPKSKKKQKVSDRAVKVDSFFDFFNPSNDSTTDVEELEDLERDWKLAKIIFERLVPYAVLYYRDNFESEDETDSSYDSDSDSDSDSESDSESFD